MSKDYSILSIDYLHSVFDIDPSSPSGLRWKAERSENHFPSYRTYRSWHSQYAGTSAGFKGSKKRSPYWKVRLNGSDWYVHRIIYAMHHGYHVTQQIDHIDGNGLNNRIENLREVSQFKNARNVRKYSRNTSGFTGVNWAANCNKWRVQANYEGTRYQLGFFENFEEAVAVRKAFNLSHDFDPRHGKT